MSRINVLHVTFAMNRGGMESRLMDLYRHIDRDCISFDFLENTDKKGVFDKEILSMGGHAYHSGYSRQNVVRAAAYIKRLFLCHQYDIVHIHESYLPSFNMLVIRLAKKYQKGLIILHSRNAHGTHPCLHMLLRGVHAKRADYYLACSKKAAEWMFPREIIQAGNYKIIQNAIDAKKFAYNCSVRDAIRKELGLAGPDIAIGHVGRFFEQKNHMFLIDVFKNLLRRNPSYLLILVGDGPLRARVKEKAQALGILGRIKFLGIRGDMERIYQAFDVFVLPSLYEGLPGVGVEAQAAGLLCFLSDTIAEEANIVNGLCKRLPIDKGAGCWVQAVEKSIPEIRNRHDTYADMAAKGFDICSAADKLYKFYKEICGKG